MRLGIHAGASIVMAAALSLCLGLACSSDGDDGSTSAGGAGAGAPGGSSAGGAAAGGAASGGTAPVVCDLGTVYPNQGVIDPDAPVFEDGSHTQTEVTQMFADAKTLDSKAYRAYAAAYAYADLLPCAFCKCGCASPSIGHLSAVDCFKDLHGFT